MSNYYLFDKMEEIKNKNISEEEKREELRKLLQAHENMIDKNKKKQIKRELLPLAGIVGFFVVFIIASCIFENLDVELFMMCIVSIGVLIYFTYLAFKNIRMKNKERYWKKTMESEIADLQSMCEELSDSFSEEFKKKRNNIKFRKFISTLAIILPCILFPFLLLFMSKYSGIIIYAFAIVYTALLFWVKSFVGKAKEEYKIMYKKEVISNFIKSISRDLTYSEVATDECKIKSDYGFLEFDNKDDFRWRIIIEDYIYGNIDESYIEMADIVSYEHYNTGKGNNDSLLFSGNFVSLNINKTFEESKIIKNKINIFDKNELINSDNEKFNKYFEIHAQNKDAVQSYLTPSLIDFLADFREKYKIDFEIIFKDKIYARFYTKNMFEPKMSGKIVDEYSVYQYYVITKFAKELVEKLNIL